MLGAAGVLSISTGCVAARQSSHPLVQHIERAGHQLVHESVAAALKRDKADAFEHAQVSGENGASVLEVLGELTCGVFATQQKINHAATSGMGNRAEFAFGAGGSAHRLNLAKMVHTVNPRHALGNDTHTHTPRPTQFLRRVCCLRAPRAVCPPHAVSHRLQSLRQSHDLTVSVDK